MKLKFGPHRDRTSFKLPKPKIKLKMPKGKLKFPSRGSKERSLSTTVMRFTILLLLSAVACISIFTMVSMSTVAKSVAQKAANASIKMAELQLEKRTLAAEEDSVAVAGDNNIVMLLEAGVYGGVRSTAQSLRRTLEAGDITLTDATGTVVARTSSTDTGDSLQFMKCVSNAASAAKGTSVVGMEKGTQIPYGIHAAAPIYSDGKLLGIAIVSYDLSDNTFVDELKEMTDNEFTVFMGNERISTTLEQDGERAVGTTLDEKIADVVINQNQSYNGSTKIFNESYIANYTPITTSDGSVTGVLFSGYSLHDLNQRILVNTIICIVVALAMIALGLFLGGALLKKSLKKPLEKVVYTINAIAVGDMNDEVTQNLASIEEKNEIGSLARSMEEAVRSIKKIDEDTQYLAKALAAYDLTASVDTDCHKGIYKNIAQIVATLFQEIVSNLKGIRDIAAKIDSHTATVSEASQSMAQGSTEQASSIDELAATISSIATQVEHNASNAENASALAHASGADVQRSNELMENLLRAMNEITKTSNEINSIVTTIDELAFQTNILALNAAVEAAHAGQHGRGFAVVADEVRNLAGQSAQAAQDTATLVESSLSATQTAIRYAHETSKALSGVVTKSGEMTTMIANIATAAADESQMIAQVNIGIDQIVTVVQANSAIAEETAATSHELGQQTQKLKEMVGRYQFS